MLATIVSHAIALTAGLAAGWYGHYKLGAKLAIDAAKIRTDVKGM